MRIISWNCRYGFSGKKNEIIMEDSPDILVIQECMYQNCVEMGNLYKNKIWYGDGKDSLLGIGMFSNKYSFELLPRHFYDSDFRYIVPYMVKNNNEKYTILVVWTKEKIKNDIKHCLSYVENIHMAIDYFKGLLPTSTIIIGDFNSNKKWDNDYKNKNNHSSLIEKLNNLQMINCADNFNNNDTYYYMFKGKAFSVVDDYCFVSKNLTVNNYKVGDPEKYLEYSDHCPIIIDIESVKE